MPLWANLTFQDSASPSMEQLIMFHDFTMSVLTLVTSLVALTMVSIMTLSLTNRILLQAQTIEIIWTVLPVFILLAIALPSLQVLYLLDDPLSPSLSLKALGHQWYWSYEYSDFTDVLFDSYMSPQTTLTPLNRLLDTDNALILPTMTQIRLITTGMDVIHAWAVPALGLKADAVPGRLNQISFMLNRPGMFYGQCSEICGANHSFMPIQIEAIPMKFFTNWLIS